MRDRQCTGDGAREDRGARNPAYSVKRRIGAAMILDTEQRRILGSRKKIIEPTSQHWNSARLRRRHPRRLQPLATPKTMAVERRKILVVRREARLERLTTVPKHWSLWSYGFHITLVPAVNDSTRSFD